MERLEILAIERGEFWRRLMEFLQEVGPRAVSLACQDYELHAAIVQHDLRTGARDLGLRLMMAASRSIQPCAAAASTMEYSPEML